MPRMIKVSFWVGDLDRWSVKRCPFLPFTGKIGSLAKFRGFHCCSPGLTAVIYPFGRPFHAHCGSVQSEAAQTCFSCAHHSRSRRIARFVGAAYKKSARPRPALAHCLSVRLPACIYFKTWKATIWLLPWLFCHLFYHFQWLTRSQPAFGYFYFSKTKIIYTVVEK